MSILAEAKLPTGDYESFMSVMGALGTLVVLSMCLERALAFVFEHEWFVLATTTQKLVDGDPPKQETVSRFPGLKGLIAFAVAGAICVKYKFDIIATLFEKPTEASPAGILMTTLVAAGGSAGAIALFQGFLNINKQSRDAAIAANKAESAAALSVAKANKERIEAEAATAVALAKAEKAKAEKVEAIAKAEKAEAGAREAKAKQQQSGGDTGG